MRKLIATAAFLAMVAGIAFAADHARHATYTDPSAANKGAVALCKGFYGEDDNRSPCQDWCEQWRQSHEGATCECAEGKCDADETH